MGECPDLRCPDRSAIFPYIVVCVRGACALGDSLVVCGGAEKEREGGESTERLVERVACFFEGRRSGGTLLSSPSPGEEEGEDLTLVP